jgi:HPr Serine kinase C-terminal domain
MAWSGDDRAPDVTVRFGSVPEVLEPAWKRGPVQIGRDGACHLEPDGIGRFHLVAGRAVIVEACHPHDMLGLRSWLLGPVLGTLCHQRGQFPLHAACIRIGGGAVALTGRAGTGKSTLAAALIRYGHSLVADDVCVLESTARGPHVLPSIPRLKLCEDALLALGIPAAGMPRARSGKRKFDFRAVRNFNPEPVRLRAIYVLDRADTGQPQNIRTEAGATAVVTLSNEIYRREIGFHLGRKTALLSEALRIGAAVPVCRLSVGPHLGQPDASAERIAEHFASLCSVPSHASLHDVAGSVPPADVTTR